MNASSSDSDPAEPPARILLNEDGSAFEGLEAIGDSLSRLDNDERKSYRNANAEAIAHVDAGRLLVVAGPGAGKSHLFISRIEYWLAEYPNRSIYVATFVRKLVRDLEADIARRLSVEDRKRVHASTLHSLARGLLERANAAPGSRFRRFIRIIDGYWAKVVWDDTLAFHSDLDPTIYSAKALDAQFHTEQLIDDSPWPELRATHQAICEFYNAVGFALLIRLSREALESNSGLNEHQLWIVDEYQDFNPSEDHLIRQLTKNATGVVLAGDDEQALYQKLKASDPAILVGLYGDASFAKALLPYCSRCSYYICCAASAFMALYRSGTAIEKIFLPLTHDPDAARVQVIATATPAGAVDYVRTFMGEHEDDYAAYLAERSAGNDTDPFLLILSPSGALTLTKQSDADRELKELVASYVEATVRVSADYRRVVAYATACWYESDNFALRKVLHHEGVSVEDVHALVQMAMARDEPLFGPTIDAFPEIVERIRQVGEHLSHAPGAEDQAASELSALLGLDGGVDALAEELRERPISSTTARDDEDEEAIDTAPAIDPVALMTIVGSKGLSAHHVIVLGCDNVNMGYLQPLPFFVALTRARLSLHLVVATKVNGARASHPFVLDLPEELCDYHVYKKTGRVLNKFSSKAAFEARIATWAGKQSGGQR